jgi:RNA polymerase sigma-70 factor (ECF subfamily)
MQEWIIIWRRMNHAEPAPVDEPSDEELVRRISTAPPGQPDREAEQMLCTRYYQRVRFMLRHKAGSSALADDLTHDTFIILIRHLREQALREPDKVWAYLHRTAHFVYVGWVRKEHRRPVTELSDDLPNVGPNPEEEVHAQLAIDALLGLIDELPVARDREILHRRWVLAQEKAEVCKVVGVTPEHYDRVLWRALKRFRELLGRKGLSPDDL